MPFSISFASSITQSSSNCSIAVKRWVTIIKVLFSAWARIKRKIWRSVSRSKPSVALVLETDTPDMPVFGFQGQPNRPERIVHTFEALCRLRSENAEVIKETAWQNSLTLFG